MPLMPTNIGQKLIKKQNALLESQKKVLGMSNDNNDFNKSVIVFSDESKDVVSETYAQQGRIDAFSCIIESEKTKSKYVERYNSNEMFLNKVKEINGV